MSFSRWYVPVRVYGRTDDNQIHKQKLTEEDTSELHVLRCVNITVPLCCTPSILHHERYNYI